MAAGGLVLHAPTATATAESDSAAGSTGAAAPAVSTVSKVSTVSTAAKVKTTAAEAVKAAKSGKSRAARQKAKAMQAVAVAKRQIGDPYRYGAEGPGSFDCSGLTQFAWKKAGVSIPRVASSQFARIRPKIAWKRLQPGDLVFFYGLGHVGMYVGNGKMVHSPNSGERVRIEKLTGWRKRSFVGAVRPGM